MPKSISCGKTFHGLNALSDLKEVFRWLKELGRELEERVAVDRAENARQPKLLTIHAGNISRSGPLRRPTADVIAEDALALVIHLPPFPKDCCIKRLQHSVESIERQHNSIKRRLYWLSICISYHSIKRKLYLTTILLAYSLKIRAFALVMLLASNCREQFREGSCILIILNVSCGCVRNSSLKQRYAPVLQLKKWTSTSSNWVITGMSLGVSNFVAAPTGKSTLSRYQMLNQMEQVP